MNTCLADQFLLHYSNQLEWHQPELLIAEDNRKSKKIYQSGDSQYSFFAPLERFQKYGPGIFLFFKFMKVFMVGMLVIGILSLPTLVSYWQGGGLDGFGGGWNKLLGRTTLANQQYYDWSRLNSDVKLQDKLNNSKLLVIWNDVLCSLTFVLLLFYWKVSAAKLSKSSILHRILPSSYTVLVKDLPITYNQQTLKEHFEKFGEVVQISPVKNISSLKAEADKIDSLVSKILTEKKRRDCPNSQGRAELEMHLNAFLNQYHSYKFNQVKSAIVSFNLPKVRSYVSDLYKYRIGGEEVMRYQHSPIKVRKFRIEPINIIWENFHLNRDDQIKKSLILGVILFFIISFGLIVLFLIRVSSFVQLPILQNQQFTYQQVIDRKEPLVTNTFCYNLNYKSFKDQYFLLCKQFLSSYTNKLIKNIEFSLVLIFLNWTLNQIVQILIRFRKYSTVSERNRFSIICLFVFMFFTNCILTLLVQGEVGNVSIRNILSHIFLTDNMKQIVVYKQFSRKWFLDIGSQIIINNIIALIICPPLGIAIEKIFKMVRSIQASKSTFQKEMNQLLLDPILDINFYYAQLLTTLFFCLMYSSAIPILYFLAAISLLVIFFTSKLMFVRYTRQPYLLDHSLDTLISRIIPLGLLIHQAMSFTFFSVQQFFPTPLLVSTKEYDGVILRVGQGLPFIIILILLLIYIMYQKQIDKVLISHLVDRNSLDQKPLKEILALESRYLYSYKIQDNPEYSHLLKMIKILEEIGKEDTKIQPLIQDPIPLNQFKETLLDSSSTERKLVQ